MFLCHEMQIKNNYLLLGRHNVVTNSLLTLTSGNVINHDKFDVCRSSSSGEVETYTQAHALTHSHTHTHTHTQRERRNFAL